MKPELRLLLPVCFSLPRGIRYQVSFSLESVLKLEGDRLLKFCGLDMSASKTRCYLMLTTRSARGTRVTLNIRHLAQGDSELLRCDAK